jgi:hypothetical protein
MNAQEKISTALQASVFTAEQAEDLARELYGAVAHELAEKQRVALAANPGLLEHELIDLIDPKKEGQ